MLSTFRMATDGGAASSRCRRQRGVRQTHLTSIAYSSARVIASLLILGKSSELTNRVSTGTAYVAGLPCMYIALVFATG